MHQIRREIIILYINKIHFADPYRNKYLLRNNEFIYYLYNCHIQTPPTYIRATHILINTFVLIVIDESNLDPLFL